MNAITTIEPAAIAMPLDAWIDRGRLLAQERREIDWRIGDWLHEGRESGLITQGQLDFAADALQIDVKRLKQAEETAVAFPPALRDLKLSIEHYAAVRSLPKDEQLPLIRRARTEHLTPEETRSEAIKVQARLGQRQFFERDDPDHDLLMAITRAWNRANPTIREEFIELARESDLGVIDA